jgi:hypothetical protein
MTRDTRRPSGEAGRPESDVELGCSFFEKWVIRLKVRRITRRRLPPRRGPPSQRPSSRPSRSRRNASGEVGASGAARRGSSSHRPDPRRQRRVIPPLRAAWRGASSALCRTPKPGATGGRSGQLGREPYEGLAQPPSSFGETTGGARLAEKEAPEIGDAGRAFSADGADGPHARGVRRHVRARLGKT